MSSPAVSMCAVESERLLAFGEAAAAVIAAANGLTLPATFVAALRELDQLGQQLHIGAVIYVREAE